MLRFRRSSAVLLSLALLCALIVAPAQAAGFAIFEQGGKAMGMGGAFAAQGDDASTMFYNVGGVAFFDEREFYAGIGLISLGDSEFRGAAPFPGPTATGDQKDQIVTPIHFYWVEPINEKLKFGLGLNAPFGLVTEWEDPDEWAGRFLSEKAELLNIDLNPNVAYRVNDKIGVAVGVIARFAEVELKSRSAAIFPPTGQPTDVSKNVLESDTETGFGFNLGLLYDLSERFSLGVNYRSEITVDFGGTGRLTQVETGLPVFDDAVAALLPFDEDLPIETSIDFPDQLTLGFAYRFGEKWVAEVDWVRTGWSSFDTLVIDFTENPLLSTERYQGWDDTNAYRGGAQWSINDRSRLRFGLYFDESPQPDETVSPLLPDADRWGYSVGYGHQTKKLDIDAYLLFVDFDERTTLVNIDNFDGTYDTDVLIVGASVGF